MSNASEISMLFFISQGLALQKVTRDWSKSLSNHIYPLISNSRLPTQVKISKLTNPKLNIIFVLKPNCKKYSNVRFFSYKCQDQDFVNFS